MDQQFDTNGIASNKSKNTDSSQAGSDTKKVNTSAGATVDGYIQKNVSDDPIMRFVYKYKTQLLALVAIGGFAYYASLVLNQSKLDRLQNASNLLEQVKVEYTKLVALPVTDSNKSESKETESKETERKVDEATEITNKLQEQLKVLNSQPEPYRTMSAAYSNLIAVREKKWEDLKQYLEAHPIATIKASAPERFYAELTNLTAAKSLLGQAQFQDFAQQYLINLANDAEFVSVNAYRLLESIVNLGNVDSQKINLEQLKKDISTKHPEFAAQLE